MATALASTTTASPSNSRRKKRTADDATESVDNTVAKKSKGADEHSDAASLNWNLEDLSRLVGNLAECLPPNDLVKYNTTVERIDWERVRFGSYSATECKEMWLQVMQKLRKYRTLTDLVTDAQDWLKRPRQPGNGTAGARKQKHPDLPKKPLTPYMRYFLEKREKFARENPELTATQLTKLISQKFHELSEKKKQKYKDSFNKENEVYKSEVKKFRLEHPDMLPEPTAKQAANSSSPADAVPEKPHTPLQLFTLDRLKKPEFIKLDKKEAQEEIRKQWAALSDGKRLKWIRRALQDQQRYEMEVEEYSQTYPNFKAASVKPILSKAEQDFKDKCDGKPERPPNSGYSLFSRIMMRQLKQVPSKEKMVEISRLWKALNQGDRDSYNAQALKANAKYKEKYAAYLSNLPEEERQRLESEPAKSGSNASGGLKKGSAAVVAATPRGRKGTAAGDENRPPLGQERPKPKKPLSAMFFFQQEKVSAMKERCPDMSHQEIMRALAREFSELPDRKKEKYKKMATEAKEKAIEETNGHKEKEEKPLQSNAAPSLNRRNRLFKGEPKKPPQSGYGVFSTEMLSQLVDVDPKHRMAEIAKRWNAMPEPNKERYKRAVQELQRKYDKELNKFLENLTPDEKAEYEARKAKMKDKRKGGAIKAAATRKEKRRNAANDAKTKEEQNASSSESSSEESSEEEEEDDEGEEDGEEAAEERAGEEKSNASKSDEWESSSEEESESGSSDSSSSEDEEENGTAPVPVKAQPPSLKQGNPEAKPDVNNKPHEEEEEEDSSDSDSESSSDSSDDDDDDSESGSN